MVAIKFAALASTIALMIAAPASGDAILTLGTFSSGSSTLSAPAWVSPTYQVPPAYQVPPTYQVPLNPPVSYLVAPAPISAPAPTSYDAYVNLGNGPYANSGSLTSGNALPWYDSSKVAGLFGGSPTAGQIQTFDAMVLQRVNQTFQLGGVPVALTADPNNANSAAHSLSVVSNAVNSSMPGAIGMTNVGGNGFHFIDNAASYASSVDQLGWIVAHNVAHELMLAFGVPEVHDQTGRYIDSTVGSMSMFLSPSSTFSPGAVQDLLSRNFHQAGGGLGLAYQAQLVDSAPVPEPATLAAWVLGAVGLAVFRKARSARASA